MLRRESRGNADWGRGRDHREDQEVRRGLQVQEGGVGWLRRSDAGRFDPILPSRLEWNVLITVLLHCWQSVATNCKQQKFLKLKISSWWRERTRSKLKTHRQNVKKWEESPKIVRTSFTKAQKKVSTINSIQIVLVLQKCFSIISHKISPH